MTTTLASDMLPEGVEANETQPSLRCRVRPLVLLSRLALGGAERVTVSFAKELRDRGYSVAVTTVSSHEELTLARELDSVGIVRHDLAARRLAEPAVLIRYLALLRRESVDVVHAHGQDAWILAGMARAVSRIPLVLTRHVLDEPTQTWRQGVRARCALAAARHCDALVAVSSATADRLSQVAGVPRSQIHVIRNGIQLERFDRPELAARRTEIRSALGVANAPLVLVLAALREGKGQDVLIDALPILHQRMPRARLVLAGSGGREQQLRRQAAPYGTAVLFLGARPDVPELLAAADLVVLPSFSEALPTALIEAAAAGRPVVATCVGGIPDVVQHGRTGLLVPPGDAPALAKAMWDVLSAPDLAQTLGHAARRMAQERFSLGDQIDRTLALWSEVVSRHQQ